MRKLLFEGEAREKLIEGVEMMYKAVATTLGPKGRNVAIDYSWRSPIVVHDGVTVAREVMHKDEFVNLGIRLVKEAAQKTNDEAGDGTTTSTLLAYWIVKYGMEFIDTGLNAMVLRNEMNDALKILTSEIAEIATPVKSNDEIAKVATISSTSEEIGTLVAQAVKKVGKDGLVTVDEGKGMDTYIDYTEGMEFDKGYADYRFATDAKRMEAIITSDSKYVSIVVVDKKLTVALEVANMLEQIIRHNKNIVLIGDITGTALSTCLLNKMQGAINLLVVQPPGYGERQKEYLDDIALLTGAKVLSDEIGIDLKEFKMEWVGKAKKVVANKDATMIIEGQGDKNELKKRIESLRDLRDNAVQIFDKEKYEERLAKLTTGVAVIKVGAKTEIEMREKIERVKDAIGAARAAVEEGIVPGGGVAFIRIAKALNGATDGSRLLRKVLYEPMKKILINAGVADPDKLIKSKIEGKSINTGYEMNTGRVLDMTAVGVIDPAKVIRLSLENAVSVAGSILSTDCVIVDDKEESRKDIAINQ